MMDYEAVSPPAIDEAYARIAPAYREVFCGIGAGAMRFAKQLFWQESAFPAEFARAETRRPTAGHPRARRSPPATQSNGTDNSEKRVASDPPQSYPRVNKRTR
jgi:hypothetical protein